MDKLIERLRGRALYLKDRVMDIPALLAAHKARLDAMSPAEREAHLAAEIKAQRESWVRGMAPCEHGDPDWETCPQCRANPEAE